MFAVPSALLGLTSLFGMGRGGTPTLSIALIRDRSYIEHYGQNYSLESKLIYIKILFFQSSGESLDVSLNACGARLLNLAGAQEKLSGN